MSGWVTCVCCSFQRVKSTGGWWLCEHHLGSLAPAVSWRRGGGGALHRLHTICWLALDKRSALLCNTRAHKHIDGVTQIEHICCTLQLFYIIYSFPFSQPLPTFTFSLVSLFLPPLILFIFCFLLPPPLPLSFSLTSSCLHLSPCVLYPQLLLSLLLKYLPCSLPPVRWEFLGVKDCH